MLILGWWAGAWLCVTAAQAQMLPLEPSAPSQSAPSTARQGDVTRGAAIVASRSLGLCVLCHALPGQAAALQGTLGPPLGGVGARNTAAELRLHLLAPERFNPDTVMPAYGRIEGLQRVPPALSGRPLLSPAEIDDVLAYLVGLQ